MSQQKWQFKQQLVIFEIVVLAGLCLGCTLFSETESLPFGISKPVYRLSGPDDLCSVGGVFFDFYNKSEKEVVFINACMNMFDSSGALAFDGAAGISSGAACKIPGNNNRNLCISLDEFQSAGELSKEELCIDNFFISKIVYSDGSSWEDRYGMYADMVGV